jgi:hypothetical protein
METDMDYWMQIASLAFIVMLLFLMIPRAKDMLKHTPKAQTGDWQAVLLPIAGVVGFVVLLIMLVRN